MEDSKFEYLVKTCPIENTDELQELLNEMSEDGWELYSLHEAEGDEGFQYNCIFTRPVQDSYDEDDDVAEVGHFKSRMEKLFHYKDDPYEQAKSLQKQLKEKNQRVNEIKQLLDSNSIDIDRESLNQEISKKLAELQTLKNKFAEILSPANMYDRISQDILTVVVSEELVDLIDNEKNGELILESIKVRQNLTDKLGYIIPPVHFISSDEMTENQYSINIRKLKALSGIAYPDYRLFNQGEANIEKKPRGAIDSIDPITGQKAFWIDESKTKNFWEKGLTPAQVIAKQLEFVACKYVDEILSYGDVLNYISLLGEGNLFLAEELIQGALSLGDIRYILAKLIRERVSVKDIVFVFEKLNDLMKFEHNNDQIVDNLRILLGRQICSDIADSNNYIYGIIPDSKQNAKLKKDFVKFVQDKVKNCDYDISHMAVIVKPELRKHAFYLLEQSIIGLKVISEEEITEEFNVEVI